MLLASKQLNLTIGLDIHIVLIPMPAPTPVPLPHPFVGILYDFMDYIPFIGGTVMVNKMMRSNAATMGVLATTTHIPLGTGFFPATMPLIDNEGLQFFGSKTVKADGSYFSGAGFNMMTCSCIRIPLGSPNMYLPTTTTIPIPMGNPVMVGGPQVPDLMGVLMKLLMAASLKFLIKKAGKYAQKLKKKLGGCGCG